MTFYLATFLLLILLRGALSASPALARQLFPFVTFALFLYSAFRFEVGCDWTGYLNQWQVQQSAGFASLFDRPEVLWWAIIAGVQASGLSYPWLNVASSAIFFVGVWALAKKQKDPFGFIVLLFPILILNMPMSGIRQGAAIGIMCFAYLAFSQKKTARYVILTLLASSIHSSAIVMLLFAPLAGGDFSRQRLMLSAVLVLIGGYYLSNSAAADLASTRYIAGNIEAGGAIFRVGALFLTGLFFLTVLRPHWKHEIAGDYRIVFIGSFVMCGLMLLIPISSVIPDRFGFYFIPIQCMILSGIPFVKGLRGRMVFAVAPYLALMVVLAFWASQSSLFEQCYVPYQTWLFGFPQTAALY